MKINVVLLLTNLFGIFCSFGADEAPMFFLQNTEATKNSVKVTALLSAPGFVYCDLYPAGSEPPKSTTAVTTSTSFTRVETEGGTGIVTITKLQPATSYDLYCATKSMLGAATAYSDVIESKQLVSTGCCKTITVAVTGGSYKEGTDVSSFVRVTSDGAPTGDIVVTLSVTGQASGSPFFPGSVTLTNKVWSTSQFSALLGKNEAGSSMLAPGDYTLSAVVTGSEVNAYTVVYTSRTFTILSASVPPPVPQLSSAVFSSNGLSMTVTFDSPTDRANKASVFKCSEVLSFAGDTASSCQWITNTAVSATLGGTSRVVVASPVSVVANTVRAVCNSPFTASVCTTWGSVGTNAVNLVAPASPVVPVVAISAPNTIGPCDAAVMDFSSSTGSGGRDWTVLVTVTSSTDAAGAANAQTFFANTYKISPPTAIPIGTFNAGNSYDVQVQLCNFLGTCSTGIHHLTVLNTLLPVVSILGQGSRSMVTSDTLMLQAQGYTAQCDGSKVYTDLQFSWSVKRDDVAVVMTNVATTPSKFKLDPHQLVPSSVYEVKVTVTSTTSPTLFSSASVQISVLRSDIVPKVTGGSQQSVRQGASLVLDASSSYDGDKFDRTDTSGLTFSWTCTQSRPSMSSSCGFDLIDNAKTLTVSPQSNSVVGTAYAVTVTVSDATRSSSTSVEVEITKPDAPVITVSMKNQAVKINPSTELVLLGSVETTVPTTSTWSVDDVTVNMGTRAKTPVTMDFAKGTNSFNLVLSGNSLVGKALPYVFSLTADGVTSSLTVLVNTAPSPGSFTVDPAIGVTMDTKFIFSAPMWSDVDIPVSYEFGYLDKQGSGKIVRGRAEASFGTSTLAAGDAANAFALVCQVRVFDSLSAFSTARASVIVNNLVISNEDLSAKISDQLSASAGDVDSQKETLSVASSMLNSKDCSSAPDCSALNRDICLSTVNTCGACLSGYSGVAGDDNSACMDPTISGGGPCFSDSDCTSWETCSVDICVRRAKSCTNACSGHGVCSAFFSDNGLPLSAEETCLMGDDNCEVVCACETGFGGAMCQTSSNDLEAVMDMRNQLLTNLQSLTSVDEPSADALASWQSSLSAITVSSDELSGDASDVALNVASKILDTAGDLQVGYDALLQVLNSVDSATISLTNQPGNAIRRRRLAELASTIALLDSFTTLTAGEMVSGQEGVSTINKMFRTATAILQGGSVSVPQTEAEAASGAPTSSCAISGSNEEQKVSVVSIKSRMYGNAGLTSNALRIRLVDNNLDADVPTVTVTIQNSAAQTYEDLPNGTMWVNATCDDDDFTVHEKMCPGGAVGDIPVYIRCNGTAGFLSGPCPSVKRFPECKLLQDGLFGCSVVSSTVTSITCECSVSPDQNGKRRKLDALGDSGALEVAAVSTMVVTEFGATLATADEFNSLADVKKTLTVILMYGILWASGLIGIFVCSMRQTHTQTKTDVSAAKLARKKELAESSRSADDIRNYLSTYVNEIFPAVFQPSSGSLRLWNEISKHHRYLLLFTAKGKNADTTRMITGIHLLTIQSMLMFILAVCYDLQFPSDDGTCATHMTESSCLKEKSIFDTQASVCAWKSDDTGAYTCSYIDTDISIKAVVIISVVIAIFTAPVNLLVDFLFIEVLSAPSPDALKAASAESTVSRTVQRVSNVGRRVSAAIVNTAGNIKVGARKTILGTAAPKFDVDTTRLVPDAAAEAQILATHSVGNLLDDARSNIDNRENLRRSQRQRASVVKVQKRQEQKQKKYAVLSENSPSKQNLSRMMSLSVTDDKLQESFAELCVDMTEQRKVLKRSQQDGFDAMWGVDPTGEFSHKSSGLCLGRDKSTEAIIMSEMKFVREEVQVKYNKLRFASDVQTGVEILHLFVLDLLGRDTPVAKIFLTKSEEDFRHSMVIANWVKAVAWVSVVILNMFFVYFSMLRGLERGQRWQNMYLMACILQFIIEMLFYETSECAVVHYFIPNLARTEVQSVSFTLHQAVQKICSNIVDNVPMILDAPRYLYVSTNLAQRFPNLLESVIVQSYHTYSPGELSHKWKASHYGFSPSFTPWARSNSRVRRFTISAVVIGILQRMGAMSPALQRVCIHTLQPLFVSAFILVLMVLVNNPMYFVILAPLVGYKLYKLSQEFHYHGLTRVDSKLSDVHPGSEEGADDASGLAADVGRVRLDSRDSRGSSMVYPDDDEHSDGAEDVRGVENAPAVAKAPTGPVRVPASAGWSSSSDEEGLVEMVQAQGGQLLGGDSDDSMDVIAQLAKNNFDVSSDEEY